VRAAGYGRASTTEQVEDGHSLDAQEHAIVEFCRARGWTLVEIYVDPGLSGALEDRPALQRLLRDAAQGKFDVLVVHAISPAPAVPTAGWIAAWVGTGVRSWTMRRSFRLTRCCCVPWSSAHPRSWSPGWRRSIRSGGPTDAISWKKWCTG
jgi:hypothetical protein